MIYKRNFGALSTAILHYPEETDQESLVDGKAKENMAHHIMELAEGRNVPMQKDVSLITELMELDLSYSVTPQLYSLISEILFLLKEIEKNT